MPVASVMAISSCISLMAPGTRKEADGVSRPEGMGEGVRIAMSLPIALTPGTVVGRHYVVGDLINSGGFGAVYRGRDTSEGNRLCAIKETYNVTPQARRQALLEAGVLFTVRSNHLPQVYDAFEDNGRFYLIMQLIEGKNLLQLLQSRVPGGQVGRQEPRQLTTGPCSEQEVLSWLIPIMEVLQELHSRNPPVMHRDIKPGNIILTPQGKAVLVDFGLTRLYDPESGTQTMVKAVSEGFSPVEQYLGKTNPQSDIYSMAATMYLLLTNRLPSPAVSRSMKDDLIAPRLLNPALSLQMERVLVKALSVDAQQRYASMREMVQALRSKAFTAHADATLSASPPSGVAPTVAAPPPGRFPSTPTATPPPPPAASYQSGPYQPSYPTDPYQSYAPPPPTYQTNPPPGMYPSLPSGGYGTYTQPPPGYVMVPQSSLQIPPMQALPSSFGTGCLWGLLQGLVCGLLVAYFYTTASFYQAFLVALLFYLFVGLRTTRKGGQTTRGGWAGFWAAWSGLCIFWATLFAGIGFRYSPANYQYQQIYRVRHPGDSPDLIPSIPFEDILPRWPRVEYLLHQPLWLNLLVLLIGFFVVAWFVGWIGGIFGKLLYLSLKPKK